MESRKFKLEKIPGALNVADIGTKALSRARLLMLARKIGLYQDSIESIVQQCLGQEPMVFGISDSKSMPEIILLEWCCYPDSLLSAVWMSQGRTAYRLGLPAFDLTTAEGVRIVNYIIDAHMNVGHSAFVWISLPCTPWTSWQRINAASNPEFMARNEEAKDTSRLILQLVINFLHRSFCYYAGRFEAAFEWPRGAAGWKEALMEQLYIMLPLTAEPDGCMYGIQHSGSGEPLMKPLRIISSISTLQEQLWKQCNKQHSHDECRGTAAVNSGRYSVPMCQKAIEAIIGHYQQCRG